MCWGWVSRDKCTDVGCVRYIDRDRKREREREREGGRTG